MTSVLGLNLNLDRSLHIFIVMMKVAYRWILVESQCNGCCGATNAYTSLIVVRLSGDEGPNGNHLMILDIYICIQ